MQVFGIDEAVAKTLGTAEEPSSIGSWDSGGHLHLILAIEEAFGLSIPDEMVPRLGHFRTIVEYVRGQQRRAGNSNITATAGSAMAVRNEDSGKAPSREPSYERYAREMTRLNLWYIWKLLDRQEIAPRDVPMALACRVDIYRMTTLWDGVNDPKFGGGDPEWTRIAKQLTQLIIATPAAELPRMEEDGLALLWPLLEKHDPNKRFPLEMRPHPPRPFGCWTYALEWEGIGDRPGYFGKLRNLTHVMQRTRSALRLYPTPRQDAAIHFENVFKPASPFDDAGGLADSLRRLVADCKRNYPHVRRLWCESWLNSLPVFCSLFPPAWRQKPIRPRPTNYPSLWGQFMSQTGDFNDVVAAQFRASGGRFPYPSLRCHASVDEIDIYLACMNSA